MDDTLTQAIREAYAHPRVRDVVLDTIEIAHPSLEAPLYLVSDVKPLTAKLETGATVTFEPVGFRFSRPSSDASGLQELDVTIDNVDRRASDVVLAVSDSQIPTEIRYRPYSVNDLDQPGINPPILLFLRSARVTQFSVVGKASFMDLVNKSFLTDLYRRRSFPALGY
jgi:hypothetical protein